MYEIIVSSRKIHERLCKANPKIQPDICEEVANLGHLITIDGFKHNVDCILNFTKPKTPNLFGIRDVYIYSFGAVLLQGPKGRTNQTITIL